MIYDSHIINVYNKREREGERERNAMMIFDLYARPFAIVVPSILSYIN